MPLDFLSEDRPILLSEQRYTGLACKHHTLPTVRSHAITIISNEDQRKLIINKHMHGMLQILQKGKTTHLTSLPQNNLVREPVHFKTEKIKVVGLFN